MTLKCVYKTYNKDGVLLYVGHSNQVRIRIMSHKRTSEWAEDMDIIKLKFYYSDALARLEERHAIRTEHPKFNYNGRRSTLLSSEEIEDYNIKRSLAAKGNKCIDLLKSLLIEAMNKETRRINRPGVGWGVRFKYGSYCDLTSEQNSEIRRLIIFGGDAA